MYDVKSSSGVVIVAYGVRRGMGFVPFPSVYKRLSAVEDLRGGVQSIGALIYPEPLGPPRPVSGMTFTYSQQFGTIRKQ